MTMDAQPITPTIPPRCRSCKPTGERCVGTRDHRTPHMFMCRRVVTFYATAGGRIDHGSQGHCILPPDHDGPCRAPRNDAEAQVILSQCEPDTLPLGFDDPESPDFIM